MAQGSNKSQAISIGISLIPTFIQSIEDYFGAGNGADKKAAVISAVSGVVAGVAGVTAASNPAYQNIIGAFINAFVNQRKWAGAPVKPSAEAGNPPQALLDAA